MRRAHAVLVVDDHDDIRLIYRTLLEAHGFRVFTASNAATALAYITDVGVDAVVTDIFMPGKLDGVDLVQWIRDRPGAHPVVVAISGAPDVSSRSSLQAARYVGADAIMMKPIQGDELVRTLRSLINRGPAPGRGSSG